MYLLMMIIGHLKTSDRKIAFRLCCKALRDAWRAVVRTLWLPAEGVLDQAAWHKYPQATCFHITDRERHVCQQYDRQQADKDRCEAAMTAWVDRVQQSLDSIPSGRAIRSIDLSYGGCPLSRSAIARALQLLASHAAVVDHIRELKLCHHSDCPAPDHLVAKSLQQFTAAGRGQLASAG